MMNVRPDRLFTSPARIAVCAAAVSAMLAHTGLAAAETRASAAGKADITVTSPAELAVALRNSTYKTIALAPGNYGNVTLHGLSAGVRIGAADPGAQPVFSGLAISNVDGLTLANITIKPSARPEGKYDNLVNVEGARRLLMTGLTLDGSVAPPDLEFRGVFLQKSSEIVVSDCRFSGFYRGLVGLAVDDVTVTHNDISGMSSDGINFAQASNVTITRNRFGAFQTTEDSHADYVQFWSAGTDEPSRNVTVAENLMLQGDGSDVQGIFLAFDTHLAAHNIAVRDNVIVQSSPHGISLYNVVGASVEHNLVVAMPTAKYKVAIRMIGTSDGTASNNLASGYGFEGLRNIKQSHNAEILFNNKQALASTVESVRNFIKDGRLNPPLIGQFQIAAAVRSAGVRPPDLRR